MASVKNNLLSKLSVHPCAGPLTQGTKRKSDANKGANAVKMIGLRLTVYVSLWSCISLQLPEFKAAKVFSLMQRMVRRLEGIIPVIEDWHDKMCYIRDNI